MSITGQNSKLPLAPDSSITITNDHQAIRETTVRSRSNLGNVSRGSWGTRASLRIALGEAAFHRMMALERRRTSRSQKASRLMLLDMSERWTPDVDRDCLHKVLVALAAVLRETDVIGWYKDGAIVGVLLTEVETEDPSFVPETLMARVSQALKSVLSDGQFRRMGVSFHVLSEEKGHDRLARSAAVAG